METFILIRFTVLFICLGLLWPGRLQAAHEWRAAWGAPYTLPVVEQLSLAPSNRSTVRFGFATPYDLSPLQFQSAFGHTADRNWEIHAGTLKAGEYRETHFGAGRCYDLSSGLSLFTGIRYFTIDLGMLSACAHWSGALMIRASPTWLSALSLSAGIVDQPLQSTSENTSLVLMRAALTSNSNRLILEHQLGNSGQSETTLVISSRYGAVSFIQGYRVVTGEASLGVALRAGNAEATLTRRWHPELGWTSAVDGAWFF